MMADWATTSEKAREAAGRAVADSNAQLRAAKTRRRRRAWAAANCEANRPLIRAKQARGCLRCKYNTSTAALHEHHVYPEQKTASVSKIAGVATPARMLQELYKTMTLCANCHAEFHAQSRPIFDFVQLA
jgi:hypothetical protein